MIRVTRLGLWLGLVLALLSVLSLLVGRVWMSPAQLLGAWRVDADPLAALILIELRLPRTVLALLVGAALGLSGAVLQGLTRNPLAYKSSSMALSRKPSGDSSGARKRSSTWASDMVLGTRKAWRADWSLSVGSCVKRRSRSAQRK